MSLDAILEITRESDLQPLVANGVPVFRMYGQIRIELLSALSQEHVELLADPNSDPTTGDIQWYSPFPGQKVRLADCNEDDRKTAEVHLARLIDEIYAHIDRLHASGDENSRTMADVLAMALEIPSESHIFVLDGRPVLSGWGHVPRGPAAAQKLLMALARRVLPPPPPPQPAAVPPAEPPSEPAPLIEEPAPLAGTADPGPSLGPHAEPEKPAVADVPPPQPRTRFHAVITLDHEVAPAQSWWLAPLLYAILTILLVSIGDLLLRYCAIAWPTPLSDGGLIVNYCDAPIQSSELARNRHLIAQLREAEQSLENKRGQCTSQNRPSGGDTATKRVQGANGQIGAVNVILTWNTQDDLDLYVTCPGPGGETIKYNQKVSCGGTLDVDMNSSDTSRTNRPVENIFWPEGAAPAGTYKVEVNPYARPASPNQPIEFTVELHINGAKVEEHRKRVAPNQSTLHVFDFVLPYAQRR
jgi:hypothetical protein